MPRCASSKKDRVCGRSREQMNVDIAYHYNNPMWHIQDLLGYFTILMCCVHVTQPPLLFSYYKYGFFVISGARTISKSHPPNKMLVRTTKAIVLSLVYDAMRGTVQGQNALRTHSMVFFAAYLCGALLENAKGCLVILLIQHCAWALDAPLSSLYPKVITECYDVPFTVNRCTNVGNDYPSICLEADEPCLQHVHRHLRSTTINAITQWELGYRICKSTVCEWKPEYGCLHSALFGPLGFIPCSYAFTIGALYEHLHHSKSFTTVLFLAGFSTLVLVAHLDATTLLIEDLFLGDPLSTFMISAVSCFHIHRTLDKPCKGGVIVHWCARHSACIYACQPLLGSWEMSEWKATSMIVGLVAALTSFDTLGILCDVFAPSIVYSVVSAQH